MPNRVFLISSDFGLLHHWQQVIDGCMAETAGLDWVEAEGALVLLDIDMAGIPAWSDAWWSIKARSARIIALSTAPSEAQGFAALSAGCAGYCHAAAPVSQLRQACEVVRQGGIWAGQALLQRLLGGLRGMVVPDKRHAILSSLSVREGEVARLAAQGRANKLIARQLGISERTVKAHLTATFEKLQVSDRLQLALRVNGID